MITPLKKTALHDLLNKPVLFDANIFMVGISDRVSDKNCSFEASRTFIFTKRSIRNWMMNPRLLWIHILVKM